MSASLPNLLPADDFLPALLDLSLSGVVLYTPLTNAAGEVVDFRFAYVNPAAQRLLGVPAQPATTYLQQFPETLTNGAFAFHRDAFRSEQPATFNLNYQAGGYDTYCRVAGRRLGQHLVVSFTLSQEQDRNQVEQALRESQAREQAARAQAERQRAHLERLFRQAPAAICILAGPELVFELVNPVYQQFFPERQLLGKPLREALPELADHAAYYTMREVFDTGVTKWQQALPIPRAHPDTGEPQDRYFNYIQQARYDENGQIDGVLVFGVEVTELVLAQRHTQDLQAQILHNTQLLIQERHTFFQVFANTPAAICIQRGPEHRYEYANAAYLQFFPGRQILGQTVAEALPETVESGVVALLDHVYQTGETYYGEELPLLIAQPEGPPKWMYFTFTYQAFRENGEIVGISTFAYNVADQVLARRQREMQEQRLRQIFAQAPVAIFVLSGPEHTMEIVNPAMSELIGQPREQLLGRPYFEAVPELATQGYPEFLAEVWRTGKPLALQEQPAKLRRHQPQETGYFTFVYQPLHDAQGNMTDIMCVAVDVTDQVVARQQVQVLNEALQTANDELNKTNAQLTRTNIDLDTFVYTASHDLKAPITNIESITLALREHLPPETQQDELVSQLLGLLDHTVARFQLTISQLTDLSKLQLAHTGAAEPLLLAAVVDDVRLDLTPDLQAAGARLTVEVAPDLLVSFAPQNLRSIVYNLLSNAVKRVLGN
ncbi:PAS domain S-box-containing protein [Hymenobacter luteus]|uniref:histidine kinase n=2 Tax=Hymenobacter TaxID=89966 RepID=A0A7W9WD92_9BACT|nr:PAS domain-containing protein [Hymenobacter latericoloratus]MBB4603148.1 PAS domain S-box-containing protein [Hymenobacter latericoloratus]MBB6060893.1 PAS domain S-box-containing protein [Hymenobacter luteus]